MFNMDMMRAGADAFGKIADSIERIATIAYAYAKRDQLPCPDDYCDLVAGHVGEHVGTIEHSLP